MTRQEFSKEVKKNFDAWYMRNFVSRGAGRIGDVSYTRAGELDDLLAGRSRRDRAIWYGSAYERALVDHTEGLRGEELEFLVRNPLIAFQLALGVTDLRGLRCYRRGLTVEINRLQRRSYRSRYYARDNERRRRLAAERRRITRRRTLNPCPMPEEFLAAFEHRADSVEARIRFGGLVHDLECYVDNCLKFDENGEICGRNGGIKSWIAVNLPQLTGRYKTIMRYKALAKRLRQAAEIADPIPTSAIYDGVPPAPNSQPNSRRETTQDAVQDYYAVNSHSCRGRDERAGLETRLEEVRKRLEGVENVLERILEVVDRLVMDEGCSQ